jgi:hypothetical protein
MKNITPKLARFFPLALAAAIVAAPSPAAAGARITIINADGPNEGFNDPTPVAPIGGNPGTTRGQQRLIAFQFAADIWGAALDSNIDIQIQASFDPLGPNVLGAAAARASISDFPAAPGFPGGAPATNYHLALADKRAGLDLAVLFGLPVSFPEVIAQFSSDFDFYLGLDNNHGPKNDLVVVLLHEFGHGLGFSSFMSRTTGNTPGGLTDPFLNNVIDGSTNTQLSAVTSPAERLAAIQRVDQIAWTGAEVAAAVPTTLQFGRPNLIVHQPATIPGGRYGTAAFGPPVPAEGITGTVVVAQDGVNVSTDACEPLTAANALAVRGNIALVDRGICTFNVKVKNAQDAGAIAVLVADNAPDNPPVTLGGADPTVTISSVRILRDTGTAIKSATTPVMVTIGYDFSRRAGTDLQDRALLYASTPIIVGSTLNHWDPIASRNLLMEPSINGDLTHSLIAPFDMTLAEMHDMGWFTDANLDGTEDATVIVNACDTGLPNDIIGNGARLADQARMWFGACQATSHTAREYDTCVDNVVKTAKKDNIISGEQSSMLRLCARQTQDTVMSTASSQ